jgi:hypothetical protein
LQPCQPMNDPGGQKEADNLRFLFAYGKFSINLRRLSTY